MKGDICKALAMDEFGKAEQLVREYQDIFGKDNFYIEIQDHPELDEQVARNRDLVKLSKATGAPLVATKDVHYLRPDDAEAHDILLCDGEGKTVDSDHRSRMTDADYSFVDAKHMVEAFQGVSGGDREHREDRGALHRRTRTGKMELRGHQGAGRGDARHLAPEARRRGDREEGAGGHARDPRAHRVRARHHPEERVLAVLPRGLRLHAMGEGARHHDDDARFRRRSLVSYAIDIVPVNPLLYKLPFERFLNPFRRPRRISTATSRIRGATR